MMFKSKSWWMDYCSRGKDKSSAQRSWAPIFSLGKGIHKKQPDDGKVIMMTFTSRKWWCDTFKILMLRNAKHFLKCHCKTAAFSDAASVPQVGCVVHILVMTADCHDISSCLQIWNDHDFYGFKAQSFFLQATIVLGRMRLQGWSWSYHGWYRDESTAPLLAAGKSCTHFRRFNKQHSIPQCSTEQFLKDKLTFCGRWIRTNPHALRQNKSNHQCPVCVIPLHTRRAKCHPFIHYPKFWPAYARGLRNFKNLINLNCRVPAEGGRRIKRHRWK